MRQPYPLTYHKAGDTWDRTQKYTLPAGTWTATSAAKKADGTLVQTFTCSLATLVADPDGYTHALNTTASATATAAWPLETLLCDVVFTDASSTPVKRSSAAFQIVSSAYLPDVVDTYATLAVIPGDLVALLRGEQGPPGADSTVPGPTGPQGPTGAQGPAGQGVPAGGTTGQVLAKKTGTDYDTEWVAQTGGGSGATNLSYTASPTNGTVTSDTGTDATLPLADGTNAGLMAPAQHSKLAGIAAGATAVAVDATPTDGSANAVSSNGVFDALAGKSDTSHNHSGTYDPAGTAAAAVSAHAGAADPHPGYALESALGSAAAASTSDFAPAAHVGAGGTAHANAVAGGAAGFMSGADKSKLDGIAAGATAFDGAYSSLSGKPTLGGAASLNVGTTTGTVAAGDDARMANERVPTEAGLATKLHAATAKNTLVDGDEVNGTDSAATWGLIRTTWANVWTYIKSKADTLYAPKGAITGSGLTMATNKLLGRSTAGTGAPEEITVGSGLTLSAGTLTAAGGSIAPLVVEDANTVAQRNGTTAQKQFVYNTYTDASNYERGFVRWNANVLEIGAEAAGTGTAREVRIPLATAQYLTLYKQADRYSRFYYNGAHFVWENPITAIELAAAQGVHVFTSGSVMDDGFNFGNGTIIVGRNSNFSLTLAARVSDMSAKTTSITAGDAWGSATTNLVGGAINLSGGKGASGSSGAAHGGPVYLDGGQPYGTGVAGDVIVGNTRGNLQVKNNLIMTGVARLASFTVATLPSASTSGAGAMAYVTDANATTYRTIVASGGSNKVQVTSDGTNWLITG